MEINTRKLIQDIETKYNVDEWEIDGIKIWPLLRIKLNYYLVYAKLGLDTENSIQKRSNLKLIVQLLLSPFKWILFTLASINKAQFIFNSRDFIFINSPAGNVKIENKYFDKFCSPLIDNFSNRGYSSLKLDTSSKLILNKKNPSLYFQVFLDFTIVISRITSKWYNPSKHLIGFNDFLEHLKTLQELSHVKLTESDVIFQVNKIITLKKLYKIVLSFVKPKAVFSVCYYDDYCMAMNLACSEYKIPTFDIQHGVQGVNHVAYGNWSKLPSNGYELLPNYFLCWSNSESDTILSWARAVNNHKPIIISNLFLNLWKYNGNDLLSPQTIKIFMDKINANRPIVLLTLGWDLSDEETLQSTLIAMKDTQYEVNWLVRLHPSMLNLKTRIIQMLHKHDIIQFELDFATSYPLYFVLKNIHLHITHSSSTVIEAAEFGIFSIVTDKYGWSLFEDDPKINKFILDGFEKSSPFVLIKSGKYFSTQKYVDTYDKKDDVTNRILSYINN
jgi:hypothetical protein